MLVLKDISSTLTVQQALNEIYFFKGTIPSRALHVLSMHKSECIPYLLQILKNAISQHVKHGDYYIAHLISLLLLAEFKEKQAYSIVMKLLQLPVGSLDLLFGDVINEAMPSIVASIFDGNIDPLFERFSDPDVNDFVRDIVTSGLIALIHQKKIDVDSLVSRIITLSQTDLKTNTGFLTSVSKLALCSKLAPLYDLVRSSFKQNLIDQSFISLDYFENNLHTPTVDLIGLKNLEPFSSVSAVLSQYKTYSSPVAIPPKIDRNESCLCGSGLKFKKCCSFRLSNPDIEKINPVRFKGYPMGTIAYYGPTLQLATKTVVGIVKTMEEDPELKKWHSDSGDIRDDHLVNQEIVDFLNSHQVVSVAKVDRIIGCPHEEGIDYPENEICPLCLFWGKRNRWTGQFE